MPRHRRGLRSFLACLLLGVAATIGTSWYCAARVDPFASRSVRWQCPEDSGEHLWIRRWAVPGAVAINCARSSTYRCEDCALESRLPRWSGLHRPGPSFVPGQVANDRRWVIGTGWPLVTMKSVIEVPYSAMFYRAAVVDGLEVGMPAYTVYGEALARPLPVHPIWSHLAASALLIALALWLPARGLRKLRRASRLRRRVCPTCAYPIGRLPVCTECGTGLPGRLVRGVGGGAGRGSGGGRGVGAGSRHHGPPERIPEGPA